MIPREKIYLIILSLSIILIVIYIWISNRIKQKNDSSGSITGKNTSFQPEAQNALVGYFNQLFPVRKWDNMDAEKLSQLYFALDSWYTPIIWAHNNAILAKQPNWREDRLPFWDDPPDVWEKLFDGSVCDCMRFSYPTCVHPKSRFSGADVISDCSNWPGLNVGCAHNTIFIRAYNTNNPDNNFITDSLTQNAKGFPNYSWFEGLAYPGEYGHPEVCGSSYPDNITGSQPGVQWQPLEGGDWKPLYQKWSDGPWFDSPCKYDKQSKDYTCSASFLQCVNVQGNGEFPQGNAFSGKFCVNENSLTDTQENYTQNENNENLQSISPRSYNRNRMENLETSEAAVVDTGDCTNFPQSPCKAPTPDQMDFFHGLWLYPLRGVGMWRNMGNSIVSNTKFGLLINQAGYDFYDILNMARVGGGDSNISTQFQRLITIINKGYVNAEYDRSTKKQKYPAMKVADLKEHGGKGYKMSNYNDAKAEAQRLITLWYTEGYSGLEMGDHSNGFNYNYTLYFPVGVYFGYAGTYDVLILAWMIQNKYDTLQLVIEPQNARAGLKPAYAFEVFQATPTSKTSPAGKDRSVFKDTSSNQCKSFFMIDPTLDWDNYTKYGYVSGDVVKNPQVFDPNYMTLSASGYNNFGI